MHAFIVFYPKHALTCKLLFYKFKIIFEIIFDGRKFENR